ncbi:MAG: glycosyltransferase, partial [Jannaschia sp.]
YPRFERIVAISHGARDGLLCSFPGLADRIDVILNGTDLMQDEPRARPGNAVPRLLSVGRLVSAKNISTMLDALAGLPTGTARYTLLGDGELRAELTRKAARLGLTETVRFAGYVADIRPYLNEADIFVIPSLWEGFGLAAVEAMNAGLPVVASDIPGLREVVGDDGTCGILVDPNSAVEIGNAISSLMADPDRRREMGRHARQRARTFDADRMVSDYANLIDTVLCGKASFAQ